MKIRAYILAALLATCAFAKEVPVDRESVVGHWKLTSVATTDEKVREEALSGRKEFEFRKDGTVLNVCSAANGEVAPESGTYRVDAGVIFVKMGIRKEEPAKAKIRDDALVIFPPEGPVTELIFQKIK